MIRDGDEIIGAVIGPSKCGKTSLAKIGLVRQMRVRHGLRSLVFDPNKAKNEWGPWAWVTSDLPTFERVVWATKGCAIFWDESSDTLDKWDSDHKRMFTRIRHEHRAFYVIAHDYSVLSPIMRTNLCELYLFRQDETRAMDWARLFADRDLLQSAALVQREFILKRSFQPIIRACPTLAGLRSLDL